MPPKRKATRAKAFNVKAWAKSAGLQQETGIMLSENGLNSLQTLGLLREPDIQSLGLSLGEVVKLRDAINMQQAEAQTIDSDISQPRKINRSTRYQPAPTPTNGSVLDGGDSGEPHTSNMAAANVDYSQTDMLGSSASLVEQVPPLLAPTMPASKASLMLRNDVKQLLQAGADLGADLEGSPENWTQNEAGNMAQKQISSDYDPRHVLTVFAPDQKALKVWDFLPQVVKLRIEAKRKELERTRRQDRKYTGPIEGMPSLTVAEWEAANLRLLTHLLRTGGLCRQQVDFYLSYSVQIMEYLNHYDWQSIIAFDDRYRDLQAFHKLAWGDMRIAPQLGLLKPRAHVTTSRPPQHQMSHAKPDCKQWLNSGRTKCEYGDKCRYAHRPNQDSNNHKQAKNE